MTTTKGSLEFDDEEEELVWEEETELELNSSSAGNESGNNELQLVLEETKKKLDESERARKAAEEKNLQLLEEIKSLNKKVHEIEMHQAKYVCNKALFEQLETLPKDKWAEIIAAAVGDYHHSVSSQTTDKSNSKVDDTKSTTSEDSVVLVEKETCITDTAIQNKVEKMAISIDTTKNEGEKNPSDDSNTSKVEHLVSLDDEEEEEWG